MSAATVIFIVWNLATAIQAVWIDHRLACIVQPGEACLVKDILPGSHVLDYTHNSTAPQAFDLLQGGYRVCRWDSGLPPDACDRWMSLQPSQLANWSLPANVKVTTFSFRKLPAPLDMRLISQPLGTIRPTDPFTLAVNTQPHATCTLAFYLPTGRLYGPPVSVATQAADDSGGVTWAFTHSNYLGVLNAIVHCTLGSQGGEIETSVDIER